MNATLEMTTWRRRKTAVLQAVVAASLCVSLAGEGRALAAPIKVACVGEHTTHSNLYQNTNREMQPVGMQEYPMKLQMLLGPGYDVRNFGDCCASVVQGYPASETHPYVSGGNFKNSVAFVPDVVVVGSWGRHDWGLSALTAFSVFTVAKFQTDYEDLVSRYLALPNHPKIFLSLPIPILFGQDGPDRGFKTSTMVDAVKAVAAKHNLPTVDLFSAFLGHKELFINPPLKDSEGEHANDAGLQKIAEVVALALLGGGVDGGVSAGAADGGGSARDGSGADVLGAGGSGGSRGPDGGTVASGTGGGAVIAATGGRPGATGSGGGAVGISSGGSGQTGGGVSGTGGSSGAIGAMGASTGGRVGGGAAPDAAAPATSGGCACTMTPRTPEESNASLGSFGGALALLCAGVVVGRRRSRGSRRSRRP